MRAICLSSPLIWSSSRAAWMRSKIDDFVPQTQPVNLTIVRHLLAVFVDLVQLARRLDKTTSSAH